MTNQENKKTEDKPEQTKVKPKKNKCCWIALAVFFVIILAVSIRLSIIAYYQEPKAKPTNSPSATLPTAAPATSIPKQSPNTLPDEEPSGEPDPAPEPEPPGQTISKENMINFFVEVAVTDDANKSLKLPIYRWNKSSVTAGLVEGQFEGNKDSCLNNFISDFNSLSGNVKLQRSDTNPNIRLHYISENQYQAEFGNEGAGYGFEQGNWNHQTASYIKSDIYLSTKINQMNESGQCQIIRHELTHAIGFWGHSDIFPESIMSLPKTSYSFPEVDKRLIQLMYNSGLPAGAEEAQVREYLNNNYPY